jgi:hypothetical protein
MYQGKSKNNLNDEYSIDNEYITCKKCKQNKKADKKDISRKNPNVYYKNCQRCRDYQFQKNLIHRYKKNDNLK